LHQLQTELLQSTGNLSIADLEVDESGLFGEQDFISTSQAADVQPQDENGNSVGTAL
jgi:hypothetical protein